MATRLFLGTTNTAFSLAANWDGGATTPSAGDSLQISSNCLLTGHETNVYNTVLVDSGVTFNLSTYDFLCGPFTTSGTLQMGISSNSGLVCSGLTFAASSSGKTWDVDSKIYNSGNYQLCPTMSGNGSAKGKYTQTGNGTYSLNPPADNNSWQYFSDFTVNSGVTLTTSAGICRVCAGSTRTLTINGTMTLSSYTVLGCNTTFTVGVSGNIGGNTTVETGFGNCSTVNNKVGAHTFAGSWTCTYGGYLPPINMSNANCDSNTAGNGTKIFLAGNHFYKRFTFTGASGFIVNWNNSINNPSFFLTGAFAINTNGGTVNWNKGNGTINLNGTTGTQGVTTGGRNIEGIVCSGDAIKSIIDDFTTTSLSGTGGTVQSSSVGVQRTVTVEQTGVCTGMTFKDISVGSAKKINAKGCTNNGNNKGIVFRDKAIRAG